MKSLLTSSLLFISIEFDDIVNNQSLVRRAPDLQSPIPMDQNRADEPSKEVTILLLMLARGL